VLGVAALTVTLTSGAAAAAQPPDTHGDHHAPTATSRPAPSSPVPAGFANWPDVYAFQARLNAAAGQIVAADGAGQASIVAAPANRELIVYWPGQVPQTMRTVADRLDVPVVFRPAGFGHNTLVAQAKLLASDPRVAQAAPQADGSGLAVTVTTPSALTDHASLQADATVPISVTVGERPRSLFNRQADVPRFYGGSAYESGSPLAIDCTNGFRFRFGDIYRMVTAAHCVAPGAAVRISGQPNPAGTVTAVTACRDTALIDYPGGLDPRVYTGASNSNSAADILGATPDFVGNLVGTGGATSGEHFNIPVQAVDVFITLSSSSCGRNADGPFIRAGYPTAQCAVASGDSGGPVYSYIGDANSVLARGTISAGLGTANCPNGGNTGANTVFYAPLFRPANNQQIGSLDFYRAAPPTAMTSDISGRWSAEGRQPIITMKDAALTVDMSAFGRPTARGSVISGNAISVTFPDFATETGLLEGSSVIRWSDGTRWVKVSGSTIFDLQGQWSGGTGPGPFFSVNGNALSVDMSAFHRPTAHGSIIDASTISVTFPDDRTNIGRLESPNAIRWSDNTLWTKL
jgi:hypothetical protein